MNAEGPVSRPVPVRPAKFAWLPVIALCTMVVLGLLGLFAIPRPPQPTVALSPAEDREAAIALTRTDPPVSLPGEDVRLLDLQDPTPLYLPTRWNSGRFDDAMAVERAPGTTFTSFPAKSIMGLGPVTVGVPDSVDMPVGELAVVTRPDPARAFVELGRMPLAENRPTAQSARLEIVRLDSGRTVAVRDLAGSPELTAFNLPVELLAAVDASGFIANPTVVSSSGDQALDSLAVNILARGGQFDVGLRPGIYRISIGP